MIGVAEAAVGFLLLIALLFLGLHVATAMFLVGVLGASLYLGPALVEACRQPAGQPPRDFAQGLAELAEWVARQQAEDRVVQARHELEARGLVA